MRVQNIKSFLAVYQLFMVNSFQKYPRDEIKMITKRFS